MKFFNYNEPSYQEEIQIYRNKESKRAYIGYSRATNDSAKIQSGKSQPDFTIDSSTPILDSTISDFIYRPNCFLLYVPNFDSYFKIAPENIVYLLAEAKHDKTFESLVLMIGDYKSHWFFSEKSKNAQLLKDAHLFKERNELEIGAVYSSRVLNNENEKYNNATYLGKYYNYKSKKQKNVFLRNDGSLFTDFFKPKRKISDSILSEKECDEKIIEIKKLQFNNNLVNMDIQSISKTKQLKLCKKLIGKKIDYYWTLKADGTLDAAINTGWMSKLRFEVTDDFEL